MVQKVDYDWSLLYFEQHSAYIIDCCSGNRREATGLVGYVEGTKEGKDKGFFIFYNLFVGNNNLYMAQGFDSLDEEFIVRSTASDK